MFIPHRINITKDLKDNNVLEIVFEPALLKARELMKAHPDHKYLCWNGEPARLTTRKAQYHWGWDWGPVLMTAGPWRSVRLETYTTRLADLWTEYTVDSKTVSGSIFATVEGEGDVEFSIDLDGKSIVKKSSAAKNGTAKVDFEIQDADLWFPHGYGKQTLYTFSAKLQDIDSITKKIGLRKVELVQEPDKVGKTFFFRINDVDVFCGGSDWIPADNFVPRITEEKYRKWIQMMVDGNQVMIR
jgi:beta-mannosidase